MQKTVLLLIVTLAFGSYTYSQTHSELPVYPFSYDSYLIMTEGVINDSINARFCIDTGASSISLSKEFVGKHAINKKELRPCFWAGGAGDGDSGAEVAYETLNCYVAGHTYTEPSYKVYGSISSYDALFGIEPPQQLTLEVYYDTKQFRLYLGKPQLKFDKSWTRIKCKDHLAQITIPLKIKIGGKTISGHFLFDTGSAHAIFLTAQTARDYKLTEMDVRKWKAALGLSGTSEGATIQSESIKLGKDEFKDVDIHFAYDRQGALAGNDLYLGIIGNKIFEKYDVVVDYVGLYVYIRPNSLHQTPIITMSPRFEYE